MVEVEGRRVLQYVTYEGDVLYEFPLEPETERQELQPIVVKERKTIRK